MGYAAVLGQRLLDGLRELAELPGVGDVRGLGMMAAVELVSDKATKQPCAPAANVGPRAAAEMLKRGLFTRVVGETICLAPPLVSSEEQVDRIIEVVGAAIRALEI
jgi:putrescine---pyruvate transaminase